MDQKQIEELRRWGQQLAREEDQSELRSAGRAILLLIDEVESLRTAGEPPPPTDDSPPADEPPARSPRPTRRRRRLRGLRRLAVLVAALGALIFATLALGARLSAPSLDAAGPSRNAQIGPALLPSLKFSVGADQSVLDRVRWQLDGTDVTGRAYYDAGRFVFDGNHIADGEHHLKATAAGGFPGSRTTKTWRFRVDTKGPTIAFDAPGVLIPRGHPLAVTGTLEPGATLIADGRPILVKDSRFRISWAERPTGPVTLVATDTLRNATTKKVWISWKPRTPAHPVRAVHVTSSAWADDGLRGGVLDLIAQGKINAVELDVKEEGGIVGWNAPVPLAHEIGAVQDRYDLAEAVRQLHAKGIRVIGRLVCFNDPVYAGYAWTHGRRDEVVQTANGEKYGGYGGFTNFANPVVRRYQIDIAVAAAKAGVDEILYDYVRRPDGPLSSMVFPGLTGKADDAISSFLADTQRALKPYDTYLGASVFGIAATRPEEIAQDIPKMAEHVDYVSAMVYPSHWGPGEYGVPNPNADPYEIVQRSLEDFQKDVRGTGARVVPWLQDFSLGVEYGPNEVAAQIKAARDDGIDEFLLWDPLVTYTGAALTPDARTAVFSKRQAPSELAKTLKPNELGVIPVLMHHQIRPGGSVYDMTAVQLRGELTRLWQDGFYPIRADQLVAGNIDVPKGKSPVVLTFDDGSNNQVSFRPDGTLDPNSGLGVLEAFARTHHDFPATATFYIPRSVFDGNGRTPASTLAWLTEHGYEIGNHTKDHIPLNTLDPTAVQQQIVLGNRVLSDLIPGFKPKTFALPLGALPSPSALAARGTWDGQSYSFAGVFLAGAEPAPSPFSTKWNPAQIPRLRTNPKWDGSRDFTAGMWLDILERNPGLRYVSDGNPETVAFPKSGEAELAAAFRERAKPY